MAANSDYTRGEMPVDAQQGTFAGFMNWTIYGGAFLVVVLLFPTLVFGTSMTWGTSLIATVIVAIVIGLALKLTLPQLSPESSLTSLAVMLTIPVTASNTAV